MLQLRGNDVIARSNQAEDGEVVSLRTATGEDYFRRPAAQQLGYRFPGALHRCPRMLSLAVNGRRVAKLLIEIRTHRLKHLRQKRRGGIAVEVHAVHRTILTFQRASFRKEISAARSPHTCWDSAAQCTRREGE